MAFCGNCGTVLKDDDVFCPNCGTNVVNMNHSNHIDSSDVVNVNAQTTVNEEKNNKKTGNKKNGKKLVVGLAAAAVVMTGTIAGILIVKNLPKKVPLNECIKVEVLGYDTMGSATVSIDEEELLEYIAKAKGEELKKKGSKSRQRQLEDWEYSEILELIEVSAEKESDLSNGEEIEIEISFDNEEAKEYGIKFTGDTYIYKVKGLDEIMEIDPFEELEVQFKGTAPYAYLEYYYQGNLTYTGNFAPEKRDGFNLGDTVTIQFDGEDALLQQGYKATVTSKEYACENVDRYLNNTEELNENQFDKMKKDATDSIEAYFAKNDNYIGYEQLNYIGTYALTRKENISYENNKIYVVYSAQVFSKKDQEFETQTVYFPISYTNVIIKADETLEYNMAGSYIPGTTNLKYNGWYSINGYTDVAKMYNDLVVANKAAYNCEISDELKELSESANVQETVEHDGDYIFPNSNTTYLKETELETLTKEEIRIAINEIYARHGYVFKDEELQAYFDGKDWYEGTIQGADFSESVFNEYELANKDLFVTYAEKKGYR